MSEEKGEVGFRFIWTIENYSHVLEEKNEFIRSPAFKVTDWDHIEWYASLFPRDRGVMYTGLSECICLFINPSITNNDLHEIHAEFELSFLSLDKKHADIKRVFKNTFTSKDCMFLIHGLKIPLVELALKGMVHLPNDTLTVFCRISKINSENIYAGSCFAHYRVRVQKTSFIWSINSFSELQPKRKTSILVESLSTQIDLSYPGAVPGDENIQIEINPLDISRKSKLNCKIALLDANGKSVAFQEGESFFDSKRKEAWKFPSFITKTLLMSNRSLHLPCGILTLRCDLAVSLGEVEHIVSGSCGGSLVQSVKEDLAVCTMNLSRSKNAELMDDCHTLQQDLKQMYIDETHTDVFIQVENTTFSVHKSILCARSSVFSAMFDTEMSENRCGKVDIPDLDVETVRRMLDFLYTDIVAVAMNWDDLIKLYIAADKYDIPPLKRKCTSALMSKVNLSNVVELLVFADKHSDDNLKTRAQGLMLGREREIFNSEEWDHLMKDNLQLAAETMQLILKK